MGRYIDTIKVSNAETLNGFTSLDFQKLSEKNQPNGYTGLDSNSQLNETQLPDIDGGNF